ncbi:MAG: ankyrin repeat domain-containing protein [Alphaproteobacteria bacterium]|nr:ankyrin repeat domain-containing protein [Alphaproteobacteria bacterium]
MDNPFEPFDKHSWKPWDKYVSWGGDPRTVAAQIKKVVKWGGNVNAKGDNDITPLIKASAYGYLSGVKTLFNAEAEINDKTSHKESALIVAATSDKDKVVDYLANSGANLDEKDECGLSAMERATGRRKRRIIKTLIKAGATPSRYVAICNEYE